MPETRFNYDYLDLMRHMFTMEVMGIMLLSIMLNVQTAIMTNIKTCNLLLRKAPTKVESLWTKRPFNIDANSSSFASKIWYVDPTISYVYHKHRLTLCNVLYHLNNIICPLSNTAFTDSDRCPPKCCLPQRNRNLVRAVFKAIPLLLSMISTARSP